MVSSLNVRQAKLAVTSGCPMTGRHGSPIGVSPKGGSVASLALWVANS